MGIPDYAFEIEYAIKLNIPVQIHWENGLSCLIYHQFLPFVEQKHSFFLSWGTFFRKIDLEMKGL